VGALTSLTTVGVPRVGSVVRANAWAAANRSAERRWLRELASYRTSPPTSVCWTRPAHVVGGTDATTPSRAKRP
jgi:hypothetical protein